MVAYWLWASWKVGNHSADSEQLKKLVVILLTLNESKNLVVILLLIVRHGCFLDIFLNPSYLGGNFEMHFLREQFWSAPILWIVYWVFIHTLWFFLRWLLLSFFKKFLGTDQFNIRLQFWFNIFSDILFLKTKKTNIQSVFIFLILYLHCWYTLKIICFYDFIFSFLNKTADN